LAKIDFTTLKLQKDSFIDDKLRLQVADLLYLVNVEGESGYIYLLLEHASTSDPLLPFRMACYVLAVMKNHLIKTKSYHPSFCLSANSYTGKQPFNHSLSFFDLFDVQRALAVATYKRPFQLVDLSQASDEVLAKYHWFRVAALLGKHIHEEDLLPFLRRMMDLWRELEEHEEFEYIYLSLSYIMEAAQISDEDEFRRTITQGLTHYREDKSMIIGERLKREGFEQGVIEGVQQGIKQGVMEEKMLIARNMLAVNVPLDVIARCTGVSLETLKTLKP